MDQLSWAPYESTKNFLNRLSVESDGLILSKPIMRIEEDEMIVGILTETNQFVQIVPPIANTLEDELKPYKAMNYSESQYYNAMPLLLLRLRKTKSVWMQLKHITRKQIL